MGKRADNGDGTVFWSKTGKLCVQVSVTKDFRPAVTLPWCKDEKQAGKRLRFIAPLVHDLHASGHDADIKNTMKLAACATTDAELQGIRGAVAALCRNPLPVVQRSTDATSFLDFAKSWYTGKLHERWPDHVKSLRFKIGPEGVFKKHIPADIGAKPIASFTLDDADAIMSRLDANLKRSTRLRIATTIHHVLALAVYPARLLAANPIPKGWLPNRGTHRAGACLFPDEDRKLMSCAKVALEDRVFWGTLAREGMRTSEAEGLTWGDLDLDRGRIKLDRNKTDDARSWSLDPGVVAALTQWRKRTPHEPADRVFPHEPGWHPVERFHAKLRKAGVTRTELFDSTDARRRIRIHDLRATFVTVSLANGKTETWVADRTGHRSSQMINHYRRQAREWNELDLGPLSPLNEAIPELQNEPQMGQGGKVVKMRGAGKSKGKTSNAAPTPRSTSSTSTSVGNSIERPVSETAQATDGSVSGSLGHPFAVPFAVPGQEVSDPRIERGPLEAAIADAAKAGRWDVVAQLARILETRGRDAAGNVLPLELEARRR
jgi:integrase